MLQLVDGALLYAPAGYDAAEATAVDAASTLASPARVGPADFAAFVARVGCGTVAHARAVLDVESAGSGFTLHGGVYVPKILFEAHIFYRESGRWPVRKHAPHLSNPKWDKSLYGKTARRVRPGEDRQHVRLSEAVALDDLLGAGGEVRAAALRSASWGLGQVMGFHAEALGYGDVQRFVTAMYVGEGAQFDAVARYIVSNRLAPALCRGGTSAASWRPLARGYNGAGYAVNRYDELLAAAFVRRGGR